MGKIGNPYRVFAHYKNPTRKDRETVRCGRCGVRKLKRCFEKKTVCTACVKIIEQAKEEKRRLRRSAPQDLFSAGKYWKVIRAKALEKYGSVCMKCGAQGEVHVDHIKPKSKYPEIAYDLDNLQILCRKCNFAKGYRDETDYRKAG